MPPHLPREYGKSDAPQSKNSLVPVLHVPVEKRARFEKTSAFDAALRIVQFLGLVKSYRNLHIIQLAVEAEMEMGLQECARAQSQAVAKGQYDSTLDFSYSLEKAAVTIIQAARSDARCGSAIDYFWFEDCRWRYPKLTFREQEDLYMRHKAANY